MSVIAPIASSTTLFHPAVAAWFGGRFSAPTPTQARAWPAIKAGRDTLIAAPTGSGKTLSAFLAAIDELVRRGLEGALPDETQVVYVSPLKALSNDIQKNLEAPLAGIREALRARGAAGRRNPRLGANRRHPAVRTQQRASAAAAYRGDDAGIALHSAGFRIRPEDAGDDADGDRRRDSRAGAEQARRASGAVAGATAKSVRRQVAADRPVGHAKADRDGGALSRRRRGGGLRDRRRRAHPRPRPRLGSPVFAARSRDVGGSLDAGLRTDRGAGAGASHHARLRQHPPNGGARRPAIVGPPRRRTCHRPPRQHGQGTAAGRRTAAQARRLEGAGRHRFAGARHRYRRCRSGLPARLAALDRGVPATRRAFGPRGGRNAEGTAVSADARRTGRMRGAARQRSPRRTRRVDGPRSAVGCARATDRGGSRCAGGERRRTVLGCFAGRGPTAR